MCGDVYRIITSEGEIDAAHVERDDSGVTLYTDDDEMKAFVPYPHLIALVNEEAFSEHERQFDQLLL